MLTIATVGRGQVITITPSFRFEQERGIYSVPVAWSGQTTALLCITPERLRQELDRALAEGRDIATVLTPDYYRGAEGEGVFLEDAEPHHGTPSSSAHA